MTFVTIIIFILALCVLVIVHECGHFFVAKLFGIRVDEFGIGLPPRATGIKVGETLYSLNWTPLGGFVRIWGEQPEEKGATHDPRNFAHRSRFIQAAVIIAGIVMNVFFGWVLFSIIYMIGGLPADIGQGLFPVKNAALAVTYVEPNSPAAAAGFKSGDIVTSLITATTSLATLNADQALQFVKTHPDSSFVVGIKRGGEEKNFVVRPAAGVLKEDPSHKAIGVEFYDVTEPLPFLASLETGAQATWQVSVVSTEFLGSFFGHLFSGHPDFSKVSGPIGIVAVGSASIMAGWSLFLLTMASISISLALINVLPIPGLDGGRLLFIIIEAIRKRPISEQTVVRFTVVGFALLGILVIAVSYHDILVFIVPHL